MPIKNNVSDHVLQRNNPSVGSRDFLIHPVMVPKSLSPNPQMKFSCMTLLLQYKALR